MPFGMEIDQHFIAAIHCFGYSMNDTVIVFDRVREFLDGKIRVLS
jgi:SecD/SecF fusion protein